MSQGFQIRVHGDSSLPALVYLPGVHGDWTLVSSFRAAVAGRVRFVEFAYARSVTDSLDDCTNAIEGALLANGIDDGWLLGESFGSQPAWRLIARAREFARAQSGSAGPGNPSSGRFQPRGLVLAGGFVRHPVIPAVRLVRSVSGRVPMAVIKSFCFVYRHYAKFRHRHAPETLASIGEFVANRATEADRLAMTHRYGLIAANDPRAVARTTTIPVYFLAGLIDPLVPGPVVHRWLKRNCPGYRGGRTIRSADHNVLGTAPKIAAGQVLEWMNAKAPGGTERP